MIRNENRQQNRHQNRHQNRRQNRRGRRQPDPGQAHEPASEQLRQALAAPEPSHGDVHVGLHGVRDRLATLSDELVGDAMRGSDYIARIARILGLG